MEHPNPKRTRLGVNVFKHTAGVVGDKQMKFSLTLSYTYIVHKVTLLFMFSPNTSVARGDEHDFPKDSCDYMYPA